MPINLIAEFDDQYVRPREGRTLIVGSKVYKNRPDRRKLYDDCVGVDMEPGEGVDHVVDLAKPWNDTISGLGPFKHIECISVLEHCQMPWVMAENLERLLSVMGTIHVAVPFIWRLHQYPGDYFRFTIDGIKLLFPSIYWLATKYANHTLMDPGKIPTTKRDDHQYIARTETYMFGYKPHA